MGADYYPPHRRYAKFLKTAPRPGKDRNPPRITRPARLYRRVGSVTPGRYADALISDGLNTYGWLKDAQVVNEDGWASLYIHKEE